MTAQSVKTQPMDFSRGTLKQKLKSSANLKGFDQVMDSNLKVKVNDNNKPITRQNAFEAKVKEVVEDVIRERSKVNSDMKPDTVPLSNEEPIDDVSLEEEILIPDEQILEILGLIQQAIMDVLNIDTDQLAKQMDDLGIATGDLLNPDTLRQIVLSSSGESEVTAFLTNENLANSMNELMDNVRALLSDAGINLSEDELKVFAEKLHNIETRNDQNLDETSGYSQQIQEDISSMSIGNKDRVVVDENSSAERSSINIVDNIVNETGDVGQSMDETIDGEVPNAVNTQEPGFSQTDQDDNNSNEMNSKNQFDGFIDQMINVTQGAKQVDFIGNEMQVTELREIANQIIQEIKVTVLKDQTSMELQLNPENLGKVNLSLQSKDGVLTAQFVVNNDRVKEAIESQMIVLKDSLEQQGLKVETIEVTVANYTFDQRRESNSSDPSKEHHNTGRKITLDEALNVGELPQDEEEIGSLNSELGNQIDYTA